MCGKKRFRCNDVRSWRHQPLDLDLCYATIIRCSNDNVLRHSRLLLRWTPRKILIRVPLRLIHPDFLATPLM